MRTISFFVAFLVWFCAKTVLGHIIFGPCYDLPTPATLNLKKWSAGKWYEIQRYENDFEKKADCGAHVFFLDETGGNIDISINVRHKNGYVQSLITVPCTTTIRLMHGKVNYSLSETEMLMNVTFPNDSASSSFDIFATDIDNYAIVYSCHQVSNGSLPEKQERLWVLGRAPNMSEETMTIVRNALVWNGTDLGRYLDHVSQEECI